VFAYLPDLAIEEQNTLIRFLIESSRKWAAFTSLIVGRPMLLSGILDHPYLRAISQIIINVESGQALREEEISALATYRQSAVGFQNPPTLWIDAGKSSRPNALASLF